MVHVDPIGNGLALPFTSARTCAASRSGATDSISATTPLTSGAEKLVPARNAVESASGTVAPVLSSARKL